jgi:hypothetical protein
MHGVGVNDADCGERLLRPSRRSERLTMASLRFGSAYEPYRKCGAGRWGRP